MPYCHRHRVWHDSNGCPPTDIQEDINVYDLAERMSVGRQITFAGQREVAAELLRVRDVVRIIRLNMRDWKNDAAEQVACALAKSMGIQE
jgi:ABC-type cobalamin/Fe3+-siderophores transport system ATPase subunit